MPGTDNSLLGAKVKLRCGHLPTDPFSVLDCFGGYGVVWREVAKQSGRTDIRRVAIDKEDRPGALCGDNRKWLESLDLSEYAVIDLDAYGVPYDQVEILFRRKYCGTVFFTFIQSVMGQMPARLLSAVGIGRYMRRKCPTLYGKIGWTIWLDWLGSNGVDRVWHYSTNRKHYGVFILGGRVTSDTSTANK